MIASPPTSSTDAAKNNGIPGLRATWSTENRLSRTNVNDRSPSWIDSPWLTVAPIGCAIGLSAPSGLIMKNISPGRSCNVSSSGAFAGFSSGAIDAQRDTGREEIHARRRRVGIESRLERAERQRVVEKHLTGAVFDPERDRLTKPRLVEDDVAEGQRVVHGHRSGLDRFAISHQGHVAAIGECRAILAVDLGKVVETDIQAGSVPELANGPFRDVELVVPESPGGPDDPARQNHDQGQMEGKGCQPGEPPPVGIEMDLAVSLLRKRAISVAAQRGFELTARAHQPA